MRIQYILLAALSLSITPSSAFSKPQEIALKKQNITIQQMGQLCKLLPADCRDKPLWNLYKTKAQQYYLIDDLKLYQLKNENKKWYIQTIWDFSNYDLEPQTSHWANQDEGGDRDRYYIFPKLFPISDTEYTVGLVQKWRESYSGGGLSEEVADFLKLKNNGKFEPVFKDIPFSLNRMIRVCFSEQEYQDSEGRCHDEYALDTQIEYVKAGIWKIKYHYQRWISNASDSGEKDSNQSKDYILDQNNPQPIHLPEQW